MGRFGRFPLYSVSSVMADTTQWWSVVRFNRLDMVCMLSVLRRRVGDPYFFLIIDWSYVTITILCH